MVMNHMIQIMKQLSGKINPNLYTSINQQSNASQVAYLRQLQRELKRENVLEIPFSKLEVTVFDIETTGFYPDKGDRIISIGAVKMKGETIKREESFYSLVFLEKDLSQEIAELTGISKEELKEAPPIEEVLKEFYKFIQSNTLVAHHANHEKSFMQHMTWSVLRSNFQHRLLDTSFLTKVVAPEQTLITLDDFCHYYNIEMTPRHHALNDAMMTACLWSRSVQQIQQLGFKNLSEVYSYLAKMK